MKSFFRKLFGFTVVTIGVLTVHDYTLHKTPETNSIPICDEAKENFNCNTTWLSRICGFPIDDFNIKFTGGGITTQGYRLNLHSPQENIHPTSMFVKYMIRENSEPLFITLGGYISDMILENFCRKEVFFL
jgi:hypothetical protein